MSPLAKSHPSKPGLTERFELYINKFELINAYGELSDPVEQSQRFANQLKDLQVGDEEAMNSDETFCEALEYGMPPIAGWGLGIDRLTLLLTDSLNIKEVILFPAMRPQQHYEPPAKEDQISEKSVESQDDTAALVEGQDDTATLVEVSQILGELLMWDDNCKK